ncbi:hypothetical protein [Pontibacter burrus]|uniref:Uncharacterized protein n=1 Tax=Pontibacter burrus TaxID=2704466 RepID=A0A6B3LP36_9BACT|nr:hypothetical protein [Pontibacter burrus]NEM97643.1 hypothetical protein [Pontibacter burrus]
MKRNFTLLLLIIGLGFSISNFAQAQTNTQTTSVSPVEYVRVQVSPFLLRKNYTAYLNFGRADGTSDHIKDASGNKIEFSAPTGVLNYLGTQGWEFVAYIPDDDGKLSDRIFLMCRSVQSPN